MRILMDDYRFSNEEKRKIDEFIALSSSTPASHEWRQTAFHFLAARKFSVPQALELYHSYQNMLIREEIGLIDPFTEEVKKELLSGKFVILNDGDTSGARVAQLFVRLCRSSTSHQALLQSILFQLDATMRRETAIRNGLVFIYDMTDAKFSNVDCAFAMKLFKLLQCSYPVRLRRVIILTAPLWFRASLHVMRGFIRDHLRDIVIVLRPSPGTKLDALSHPDPHTLRRDYHTWLHTALQRTGWISTEAGEQQLQQQQQPRTSLGVCGNGHLSYSPSDFFGATSSHGPGSTWSDDCTPMEGVCCSHTTATTTGPQSADEVPEEEDCCSTCFDELDEDVFSLSAGVDMDPFALSSSYSSEADGSDIVEVCTVQGTGQGRSSAGNLGACSTSKRCSSSDEPGIQKKAVPSTISTVRYCGVNPDQLRSCPRDGGGESVADHGSTPTPPLAVKRIQLPAVAAGEKPAGHASKRPVSTPVTELPLTGGGSGDCLATPIVCSSSSTANISGAILRQTSSCCSSSTASFFSTGSVGCGGLSGSLPRSPDRSSPSEDPQGVATSSAGVCVRLRGARRVAPLAEDEIGSAAGARVHHGDSDQQSMNEELEAEVAGLGDEALRPSSPCCEHPPSLNSLPVWAVGRPTGQSIHLGPFSHCEGDITSSGQATSLAGNSEHHALAVKDPSVCPQEVEMAAVSSSVAGGQQGGGDDAAHHRDDEEEEGVRVADGGGEEQQSIEGVGVVGSRSSDGVSAGSSSPGLLEEDDDEGDAEELGDNDEEEEEEEAESTDSEEEEDEEPDQTFCLDDYWMTPEELANHVVLLGTSGLQDEYAAVVRKKTDDPRSAFKHARNREKNRYCDVICYETNRVHLRPLATAGQVVGNTLRSPGQSKKLGGGPEEHRVARLQGVSQPASPASAKDLVHNYIHANWVDGYRQKNAFICTQGPLIETCGDFWRMVWDYHVPVIVMITKVFEAQRPKCYQYWPDSVKKRLYFATGCAGHLPPGTGKSGRQSGRDKEEDGVGQHFLRKRGGGVGGPGARHPKAEFEVVNTGRQVEEHFVRSSLRIVNLKKSPRRVRHVEHFAYCSWPDHGVPQTTVGLQQLLSATRSVYAEALGRLGYQSAMDQEVPPPPVVVHCSAGIGRTGTYVTADICTKRLTDAILTDNRVNIPLTVSRVRSQRFGCVQVAPQYLFCYRVLIDYAVNVGLLSAELARPALEVLTPVSPLFSPSMYQSSGFLPRSRDALIFSAAGGGDAGSDSPVPSRSSGGARGDSQKHRRTLFELRHLLQSSNFLSIWNAMRPRQKGRDTVSSTSTASNNNNSNTMVSGVVGRSSGAIVEDDFVMTENMCSQSESDSTADISSASCSSSASSSPQHESSSGPLKPIEIGEEVTADSWHPTTTPDVRVNGCPGTALGHVRSVELATPSNLTVSSHQDDVVAAVGGEALSDALLQSPPGSVRSSGTGNNQAPVDRTCLVTPSCPGAD